MRTTSPILRAAAAITATAALIAIYTALTHLFGAMPRCVMKRLTGFDCPGCGSQRALHALLDGHPLEAWSYNLFLPFVVAYLLLLLAHWIFPASRRLGTLHRRLTSPAAIWTILSLIIVWTVVRNLLGI